MSTKKVKTCDDDYGDFPYEIWAYRKLTKEECLQIISEHEKKHGKRLNPKEMLTIETEIR